jgi:hypothetical protein
MLKIRRRHLNHSETIYFEGSIEASSICCGAIPAMPPSRWIKRRGILWATTALFVAQAFM